MKKIKKFLLVFIALIVVMGSLKINVNVVNAYDKVSVIGMSDRAAGITGTAGMLVNNGDEDRAVRMIIMNYTDGYAEDAIVAANAMIKAGYFADHLDDFRNAGMPISAPSSAPAQTSTTEQPASQPQAKTEFTVTDLEPYTAWATKDCNIRSGADTTYDKAGSLKQNEEVTVNGKASTGWFRIKTSLGIEAYVSDSLLTTENPNKQMEEITSKEEASTIASSEQVAEEMAAEIENTEAETTEQHEHNYSSEVTKEATCTEEGIITYTCECGDTYNENISKLDHEAGDYIVTAQASIISTGEMVKKCNVCGEILETQTIPANNVLLYIIIGCVLLVITFVLLVIRKKKK